MNMSVDIGGYMSRKIVDNDGYVSPRMVDKAMNIDGYVSQKMVDICHGY